MKVSRKPRHLVILGVAVVVLAVSLLRAFDFSGEAPPRWQQIVMMAGLPLMIALIAINVALDRREKGGD
jgi:peptidoglycan/LPS O-acetylase OafA/YrhL